MVAALAHSHHGRRPRRQMGVDLGGAGAETSAEVMRDISAFQEAMLATPKPTPDIAKEGANSTKAAELRLTTLPHA